MERGSQPLEGQGTGVAEPLRTLHPGAHLCRDYESFTRSFISLMRSP